MRGEKSPMSAEEILNNTFLENRARLLEIASFLDRIDRAANPGAGKIDFRYRALMKGLGILLESKENRTKALQLSFSDPTEEPIESVSGLKGTYGAWDGGLS